MIRKLLLTILLFAALQSNAQFFEGFEGATFPPTGWLVADNGVGTITGWQPSLIWPPYEGAGAAFVNRENIGQGNTSEDWLITPAVPVSLGMSLRFRSKQTLGGDQGTIYEVRVSTSSQTDQSSFTTVANWTETSLIDNYGQTVVSLDAFDGQSVYIAFIRKFSQPSATTNGDRWLIDNVSVGEVNEIVGVVSYTHSTICGSDADPLKDIGIHAQGSSFDSDVFSYSNGFYSFTSLETDFSITPQFSNPMYFNVTPPSYNYSFTGLGNSEVANFCISPNGVHNDLEIVYVPGYPISGQGEMHHLIYKNSGTETLSGTVTVTFPGDLMYVYNPANPSVSLPGSYSFDFADLKPFESRNVALGFDINSSSDPDFPVNIGDVLNISASITPLAGDETPSNNVSELALTVVASADPNDKIVSEGAFITPEQTGDYLHYTIRFQNVGTAAANKVVVEDVLQQNLDLATFQPIGGSHPYTIALDQRKLEFTFDNINLPPASVDEAASQGFITFKIKPSANVGLGSVIENNANIYFDSNLPIATNTASTTVAVLKTKNFDASGYFMLYPNPANDVVNIDMKKEAKLQSVEINNILGQSVLSFSNAASLKKIDVSRLAPGTYFVRIDSDKGTAVEKFIKL